MGGRVCCLCGRCAGGRDRERGDAPTRKVNPVDFFRQLAAGIAQAWKQLSLSARVNIVLTAAAMVALIVFVAFTSARPQYVTLSTGLTPEDRGKVVSFLTEQGVDYRVSDSDQTIQVPLSQRSNAQLLLAQNDLPVGRPVPPGWELFTETDLMTNQWLQDVKFMRAVQGELQRQLNLFDFVAYSHVLIREAKEELFVSEQKPSEASVTLAVNRPVSKQETKAIVNIVSHAGGPNLHPGNIIVTTTTGEVLYMPPESEFASIASSKLEFVAGLERQREARVLESLRELGVQGTVRVSAKVDFDTTEVQSDEVLAGTEMSTYTRSTTIASAERVPEGAPGVVTNLPEGAAAPGGMNTTEEDSEEITNYEPSRKVTTTKTDPGDVVQYVVALVVEGAYEEATDEDGKTVRNYVGLNEDLRQTYSDLATAAVGKGELDTEVTIHDHPFDIGELAATTAAMEAFEGAQRWERMLQLTWSMVQILLIVSGFLLVRMFLRRAIESPLEEIEEEAVGEIPEATREDMRRQDIASEVSRLAREEPEMVAAMLRSWMLEEE